MNILPTSIAGAFEIVLAPRLDERGYFARTFDKKIFAAHGLQTEWVQENQSMSAQAFTVRGLHFQRGPNAETKLIRALAGRILDVIVDVRAGSPTFGKHIAVELSAANQRCLYIPRGCAHGFCALETNVVVHYKVDNYYAPEAEGGVLWNDPALNIAWPTATPTLSAKDAVWPRLAEVQPVEV